MRMLAIIRCGLLYVSLYLASGVWASANVVSQDLVTTTPVLADGVLYVASAAPLEHSGHLRAIDITGLVPETLWDAADKIPAAGENPQQPQTIALTNQHRYLMTNLAGELIPLAADHAEVLASAMGSISTLDAVMLLHTVRGRRNVSPENPAGTNETPYRLWGISRSSPVLVARSAAAARRDRFLYAGAEDGMLHAFYASGWDEDLRAYPVDDPHGGMELWGYLPGLFLQHLKDQPFDDSFGDLAVHLDGTPVIRESFLDLDGDGHRRWHTLLAATGTLLHKRHSCLFVLDITDPYQPQLLWEQALPGQAVGRTRGAAIGWCGEGRAECLYLTADFAPEAEGPGIHALAIELQTGRLLWQFSAPYAASGPVAASTPAVPALMDIDNDDHNDTLVFGDMLGQLWALDLQQGQPYGDGPVYIVPGNSREPIGAGIATHGNHAIFGTGGVTASIDEGLYALYAIAITRDGGTLLWHYPLEAGEKIWGTPTLDAEGNVIFATARDYLVRPGTAPAAIGGRLVALNNNGQETTRRDVGAATLGRVVAEQGVIISVAITGETTQFGTAQRLSGPTEPSGSVKILSWRPR